MSKFDELLHSLKKDIQSLPSVAGDDIIVKLPTDTSSANKINNNAIICNDDSPSATPSNKYIKLFLKHGFLSIELSVFFIILLGAIKPSFLYYREKVYIQNGRREFIKTHFSIFYLISYSIFFTLIVHFLMFLQQNILKRYSS